jgi:hypothetical protein
MCINKCFDGKYFVVDDEPKNYNKIFCPKMIRRILQPLIFYKMEKLCFMLLVGYAIPNNGDTDNTSNGKKPLKAITTTTATAKNTNNGENGDTATPTAAKPLIFYKMEGLCFMLLVGYAIPNKGNTATPTAAKNSACSLWLFGHSAEKKNVQPPADTLNKIATALDTTADYLISGDKTEKAKAAIKNSELLQSFKEMDVLPEQEQTMLVKIIRAYVRDFKARQTYAV